jgi:phthiodiolone/phenolphthiodiolone dimycocerosates ketoreductase
MKLGLVLPTVHSVETNVAVLKVAEACGVASIWVVDHLLGYFHPQIWQDLPAAQLIPDPDAFLDPFCLSAVIGTQTQLSVGTSVTDTTRRRGGDLARTSLTLNEICGGGFILGIGSGEAESLEPFGYPNTRPVGRFLEALIEIRSMLDTGQMPGESLGRTGLARDSEKGVPQVWVAAQRPRMLGIAGTYGDGWIPGPCQPDEYADSLSLVRQASEQAQRKVPTASLLQAAILGESRDAIGAMLEQTPLLKLLALFSADAVWQRHGLEHPAGPGNRGAVDVIPHALEPRELRELAERIPVELLEEFVMIGNADEIATKMKAHGDAGLEHLVLADLSPLTHAPESLPLAMAELPKLRVNLDQIGRSE